MCPCSSRRITLELFQKNCSSCVNRASTVQLVVPIAVHSLPACAVRSPFTTAHPIPFRVRAPFIHLALCIRSPCFQYSLTVHVRIYNVSGTVIYDYCMAFENISLTMPYFRQKGSFMVYLPHLFLLQSLIMM